MTIVEFLLASIAEDEAVARDYAAEDNATVDHEHQVRWAEARVLAECEAKRRIIEEHRPRVVRPVVDIYDDECETCHGSEPGSYPCITLQILAAVYADYPDYDEAWRP